MNDSIKGPVRADRPSLHARDDTARKRWTTPRGMGRLLSPKISETNTRVIVMVQPYAGQIRYQWYLVSCSGVSFDRLSCLYSSILIGMLFINAFFL